jgi:hypothetical protein
LIPLRFPSQAFFFRPFTLGLTLRFDRPAFILFFSKVRSFLLGCYPDTSSLFTTLRSFKLALAYRFLCFAIHLRTTTGLTHPHIDRISIFIDVIVKASRSFSTQIIINLAIFDTL